MSANAGGTGEKLLGWYDRHARELPWRVSPSDRARGIAPDPYRVWLSEIMLQQTTVAAVRAYFEKFTSIWPTVHDLAAANEDDLLKAWAGLGYYSRARNLKKCADAIVAEHGGVFPADLEALRALPGIGDYTSAAIASIAFDIPAPVVDGNVERVFSRLHAVEVPLPAAKAIIKSHVSDVLPHSRPGDFAQACMDLGATLCTPKRPSCLHCPVRDDCRALATADPETFPRKAPKKQKPHRRGAAYIIQRNDGSILLEKRSASGLLANMTQVPTTAWNSRTDGETGTNTSPLPGATWTDCGNIQHVFTHFSLTLTVWKLDDAPSALEIGAHQWWSTTDEIGGEALPTVMKKVIACGLPGRDSRGQS
ncbi:MAG: A/G-specific adenine glycosylase [Pseudomonadota bacterium]